MRQRDKQAPQSAEETVRDIRRATRRHFSADLGASGTASPTRSAPGASSGHWTSRSSHRVRSPLRSPIPRKPSSPASVYRILKAEGLVTSPAFIVMKAADAFANPTTTINQLWQTDFGIMKEIM